MCRYFIINVQKILFAFSNPCLLYKSFILSQLHQLETYLTSAAKQTVYRTVHKIYPSREKSHISNPSRMYVVQTMIKEQCTYRTEWVMYGLPIGFFMPRHTMFIESRISLRRSDIGCCHAFIFCITL